MGNEVDITVKATDKTNFGGINQNAKSQFSKVGDESGRSFGSSIKKWFGKSGTDSVKSFGTSVQKWFTGDGSKLFGKGGQIGGEAFSSGLMGMLKTPILGPALIAVFGAVVATVMPAIGAIAGGALVAGFGAGLAGLGLVFAAQSDVVGAKWSTTMSGLGEDMKLLSKPFESTLIHIADYFQRTVDKFNPALGKAFSDMAGPIDHFVDTAAHSLEQLIPAIDPIVSAFNDVLDAVGGALPGAIGQISDEMTKLALSVSKNPEALGEFVTGLGDIVGVTIGLITTLNDVNTKFTDMTGGLSLVKVAIGILIEPIATLGTLFAGMSKGLDLVNALLGRTGKDSADAGKSMGDAANQTALLAQGLDGTGTAAQNAGPHILTAAEAIQKAKTEAAAAKQAFEDYISSMFRVQNLSLGLAGAQINLQAATDAATKAFKDNGRNVDNNTEKGRANNSALLDLAKSTNAQTEALQRSGKGNEAAGKAAEASRANFVKQAQQMGYSSTAANKMADDMIAIPNVLRIAKLEGDKRDLDGKLAAARKELADPNLTATKRAKLEATIAQLLAAKKRAQDSINSLTGKSVTITLNTYKNMIETTTHVDKGVRVPSAHGGGIRGFAAGGNPRPGRFLVGEEGPEFLDLSGGVGRVTPASNTRQQLAQGGGRAQALLVEFKSNGGRMEDMFVEILRKFVKVSYGGNVQAALGSGS